MTHPSHFHHQHQSPLIGKLIAFIGLLAAVSVNNHIFCYQWAHLADCWPCLAIRRNFQATFSPKYWQWVSTMGAYS